MAGRQLQGVTGVDPGAGARWRQVGARAAGAVLVGGVAALVAHHRDQVDGLRMGLYAVLLAAYCVGERWAWSGRREPGHRSHVWLRWVLLGAWLLVILGAPVEHALRPRAGLVLPLVGVVLAVAGASLRFWAMVTLGPFFSPHIETWSDHRIVRAGPYRWIRHPAYVGTLVHAVGMPLVLSAWVCTGLAVALVPLYLLRAHWEDQALAGIPDEDASRP